MKKRLKSSENKLKSVLEKPKFFGMFLFIKGVVVSLSISFKHL